MDSDVIARVGAVIKAALRQTDMAAQLECTCFAALLIESE
jgi:hypothetical protein